MIHSQRPADRPRILLVEDDEQVAAALMITLSSSYEIEWMARGDGTVERVCASRPDLVLLDVQLPDGDGREIYARIRRATRDTPVVLMSGGISVASEELDERAAFLRKPFDAHELSDAFAYVRR